MALVSKILEATLTAGQTSVTFTDSDIPNSILRVYPSNSELIYESITLIGNALTVTYPAQASNVSIALEIDKSGLSVIDNLTSTDTLNALSANQGKSLKDSLDTLSNTVAGLVIPDEITDLSDVNVTSIQDGQVLAWDDVSEKFVNVTPSGGGGVNYSTTEQDTGLKGLNGETIYQKTVDLGNIPNNTTKSVAHSISNLSSIYSMYGACSAGTSSYLPLPYYAPGQYGISIDVTQTNINIGTQYDRSAYSGYITLLYTKTS